MQGEAMTVLAVLVMAGLVTVILASMEIGHRIGRSRSLRFPDSTPTTSPSIEAAVLGLMGLLISFVFYGAGNRFDIRRSLVAQEANAIGTAYLRLDLLPPATQPRLREDFRTYVRSR